MLRTRTRGSAHQGRRGNAAGPRPTHSLLPCDRLGPLGAVVGANASIARSAWARSSAMTISFKAPLTPACTLLGNALTTLATLWIQQRCSRVSGNTSRSAATAQCPIADHHYRRPHTAAAQVAQQLRPRVGRLQLAVSDRDQLLGAVGTHAHRHQHTQPTVLESDVEVDAVFISPRRDATAARRFFQATGVTKSRLPRSPPTRRRSTRACWESCCLRHGIVASSTRTTASRPTAG